MKRIVDQAYLGEILKQRGDEFELAPELFAAFEHEVFWPEFKTFIKNAGGNVVNENALKDVHDLFKYADEFNTKRSRFHYYRSRYFSYNILPGFEIDLLEWSHNDILKILNADNRFKQKTSWTMRLRCWLKGFKQNRA